MNYHEVCLPVCLSACLPCYLYNTVIQWRGYSQIMVSYRWCIAPLVGQLDYSLQKQSVINVLMMRSGKHGLYFTAFRQRGSSVVCIILLYSTSPSFNRWSVMLGWRALRWFVNCKLNWFVWRLKITEKLSKLGILESCVCLYQCTRDYLTIPRKHPP